MRIRPLRLALLTLLLTFPAFAHEVDPTHLPLGDGKISRAPRVGYIWACRVEPGAGGAQRDGPWIDRAHGTFDFTRKIVVRGHVVWKPIFAVEVQGDRRLFVTNDLPAHATGTFPIAPDDPAFQIDRNPNRIAAQSIMLSLPAHPAPAAQPGCAPGAVGILLSGVALFSALDAPGRDAVAHETQDACQGHPQESGVYHYHSLTGCIADVRDASGQSVIVGYAIDGFPITGRFAEGGRELSSDDLDECHGRVSAIDWDGQRVTTYHYVATRDFPYTVGCLRGVYDRATVRAISGPPPGMRPGGGPPPPRRNP